MYGQYLKIALRNILRHKVFSFINIAGFSISITICILIAIYIHFELSYDRYHKDVHDIFRVALEYENRNHRTTVTPVVQAALGQTLGAQFPEIVSVARIFSYTWRETALITNGEKHFYESRFFLADPSIFDILTFEFLQGNAENAFENVNAIIITEDMARKYFGDEDPLGKVLTVTNLGKADFHITGIVKNIPLNSHIKWDFLAPVKSGNQLYWNGFDEGWGGNAFYTYIRLTKNTSPLDLEAKFPSYIKKYFTDGEPYRLFLQPLVGIHLHSHTQSEIEPGNSVENVYFFLMIVLTILAVACINYINLATARSSSRAQEVGLRKVIGALRKQLIIQFLGESLLFVILALPIAILWVELLLPTFNHIINKNLSLNFFGSYWLSISISGVMIVVGLLSGSYPAIILSSYHPAKALKVSIPSGSSKSLSRNILVTVQFVISIAFIIITLVVKTQMNFIQNANAGIVKDRILVIPMKDMESQQSYPILRSELLTHSGIRYVSASTSLPSNTRFKHLIWTEGMNQEEEMHMDWIGVDFDFLETFGMELVLGRSFSRTFVSDADVAYIINETAVKNLNWESPIGRPFQLSNQGLRYPSFRRGKIIGIVKDFHFRSFRDRIDPLVLKIHPHNRRYISIKLRTGDIQDTINFIESTWDKINPTRPFDYFFFEEQFNRMYASEIRMQSVFGYAAALAILIACLGLFGLVSFKTVQRTKEIGIRKVVGASSMNIVFMLSRDLMNLIIVANIVAWPLTYLVMKIWLQNFAYRARIELWIFIISAALTFFVALITLSYHTIKVATDNPVKSLRYE